jgi:hypothetical protein
MVRKMSDKDSVDKVKDVIDTVGDVIDKNENIIRKFVDGDDGPGSDIDTYRITNRDMMKEAYEMEDKLEIIFGPVESGVDEMGIKNKDGDIYIAFGDEEMMVKNTPEGVDMEDTTAEINNGVLTVEIPKKTEEGGE